MDVSKWLQGDPNHSYDTWKKRAAVKKAQETSISKMKKVCLDVKDSFYCSLQKGGLGNHLRPFAMYELLYSIIPEIIYIQGSYCMTVTHSCVMLS